MRSRARRIWWLAGGAAVVLAAAVAIPLAVLGGGGGPVVLANPRGFTSYRACLLTGPGGIGDPVAAPVWAGMQDASRQAHAQLSYLEVTSPETTARAMPVLGSLLAGRCGVVVAAGAPERAAVLAEAPQFPSVRFVVLGPASGSPNVAVIVAAGEAVRPAVEQAVVAAATSAS